MNKPFYGVAFMPTSQRSQLVNKSKNPGPGTYDYNKDKKHNHLPKWSLKKRIEHGSCFQNLSIAPGPGGYDAPTAFKKLPQKKNATEGEKYKIYLEKSYGSSPLNLPGSLNLKAGFSFGYREIFNQSQKSPGPIYHLDKPIQQKRRQKSHDSSRGFGFGQKSANYINTSETPGPGAFQCDTHDQWKSKTCEGWTFGTSPKSKNKTSLQLGPGQYDPSLINAACRTIKFQGKNQPKIKIDNNTGPGSYDIPDTKATLGTKFNISKKKCRVNQLSKSSNTLSPFTYEVRRYMDEPDERAGFSLGKRLNESLDHIKQCPGPGSYELNKEEILKNGGYMGKKIQKKSKETAMDNFYKYTPNFNSTSKDSYKFSFGQSKRYEQKENLHSEDFGQQFSNLNTIIQKNGFSYTIGTAKRFTELKKQSGPFKDMMSDYSTIGNLPSYLKKGIKKK